MPFRKDIQKYIYKYCANHLPDEDWLENEFNFIKKEELRNLVTQTTLETYEELTPHLVQLINETNRNPELTEAQKQDEISLHMMGFVKSCTNEIIIEVLGEILGLE